MSRRLESRRELQVTPRQGEILEFAARGLTDKEIAANLGVAVSTVRSHLERIYRANDLRNKPAAVAAWQRYRDAQRVRREPVHRKAR